MPRFLSATPDSGLIPLPWNLPLADWPEDRLVALPRGISRHVVRFIRVGGSVYAAKEVIEHAALHEYRMLQDLSRLDAPAVEPIAVVTCRLDADGLPLDPVLLTRHLEFSLPYRSLFYSGVRQETVSRLLDALVVLLVRLHNIGFLWGDVSLSNALFRRDAGQFAAYLVDAETSEIHDRLSDGQREHDPVSYTHLDVYKRQHLPRADHGPHSHQLRRRRRSSPPLSHLARNVHRPSASSCGLCFVRDNEMCIRDRLGRARQRQFVGAPHGRGMRLDGVGDQVVRGQPVRDPRPVEAAPVQVFDRVTERDDGVRDGVPVERQDAIQPRQDAPLVQPAEQELAAESVVIPDARPGHREPEDAVEQDAVLHQLRVHLQLAVGRRRLGLAGNRALQRDGLAEGGEVAALSLIHI